MSLLNIKVNSPNNELTSEQISALTNNNNTILFDKNTGLINVSNTHFGGNNPNQYITITNYSEFSGDLPEGVNEAITITSINKTKDQILKLINLYGQNNIYIKWYEDPSDLTSANYTLSLSNYETHIANENTYDSFVFIGDGIESGSLKFTLLLVFENGILSEGSNLYVTFGGYVSSQIKANWNETNTSSVAYIQNKPTIPSTAEDVGALPDYSRQYFTIVSLEDNNNIKFCCLPFEESIPVTKTIYVSVNNTKSWTEKTSTTTGTLLATLNKGDKLFIKGINQTYAVIDEENENASINYLKSSKTVNIEGNIMSVILGDNFIGQDIIDTNSNFAYLLYAAYVIYEIQGPPANANELEAQLDELIQSIGFIEAEKWYYKQIMDDISLKIISAKNLILPKNIPTINGQSCYQMMFHLNVFIEIAPEILPATTLTEECYQYMFASCYSLKTAPKLPATTLAESCYEYMFAGCTSLKTAPELPATTLAQTCYQYMFTSCSSLTTAPELPATTLADSCYNFMFNGCTALKTAPELPATTLAQTCYQYMFDGCSSLTTAPELPATTLANNCYQYMFADCTSLITAPELPATTLTNQCYSSMFSGCTSLTTAPELPATTLAEYCYNCMFNNCSSLNYIKCLATDISASSCTNYWVQNVAASGTFIKNPSMSLWTTGNNGIPSGWNIYTESEYKEARQYDLLHSHTEYISDLSHSHSTYATTGHSHSLAHSHTEYITSLAHSHNLSHSHNTYATTGQLAHSHSAYLTSQTKSNWNETNTSSAAYIENKPTIPSTAEDVNALPDYSRQYLTIVSLANNNTIRWKAVDSSTTKSISISTDGGSTWTSKTSSTTSTTLATLSSGQKLLIKGSNATYTYNFNYYNYFTSTDNFNVEGNIMSLIYGDNFIGQTILDSSNDDVFIGLFYNCTKLKSAKNLILPATTLSNQCYTQMFLKCSSLTTAPELPATTLVYSCYLGMFNGCSSLTTAPELPATTLAFCCYEYMFYGCTSLTKAPKLPATAVTSICYSGMFKNCTSLTTAPELIATTLANQCYYEMFQGCTSLNYIKCLATDISATTCTQNWVNGVAASGTFVKADSMTDWTTGNDGKPSGWNIYTESEYKEARQYDLLHSHTGYISDLSHSHSTYATTGQLAHSHSTYATTGQLAHSHSAYLTSETKANWNETNTSSAAYIQNKPTIPSTAEDVGALPDYSRQYLTFTALESGKFTFLFNALQYSLDNGTTWNTLAANSTSQTVNAGNKIMWKQTGLIPDSSDGIGMFSSTGRFKVSGNVMSLYYGDNFIGQTDLTGKTYAFYGLFTNCTKLIDASNLILPATTLANRCYYNMFQSCTGLTTAPELPAITLNERCYCSMFYGCTSLKTAPELPATTLADNCYSSMFYNCTSLTTAPELSAATLFYSCYSSMFYGCTSLTTAPELPGTTLASSCYNSMFYGCTSLTKAPELPATTLANNCYYQMFSDCTSLNYIKCLATDISASSCTYNWVINVATYGTFVRATSMSDWTTGNSGILVNWRIINNQEAENVDIKYYKDNFSTYYQLQYDKRKLTGIWGANKDGLVEDYDEFMEVYNYDSDAMFINAQFVVTSADDVYHGLLYIGDPNGNSTTETDTPESGQTTITKTFTFKGLMYNDGNKGGLATVLVNLIRIVDSSNTSTIISTELTSDCNINSIMLCTQYSTQYYIAVVSELPANPSQNTIYIVQ